MQAGQPQKGLTCDEILQQEWPSLETFIPVNTPLYKHHQV